jgi:hypothetical protein
MRAVLAGLVLSLMTIAPFGGANAQSSGDQPAAATPAPTFTEAELDQLVSPVALYPDPLLANVLMASTYPLEVVEADRWADANKAMTDIERTAALDQESWHASVKALVSTPDVLDMMNRELDWTQKLGEAVLTDQPAVMAAVQTLRAQAAAEKKLESTEQQTVSVQNQGTRVVYIIEPASPDVIYVPWYDPRIVFGPWRWVEWPPFYFPPPAGIVIGPFGIAWGVGWHYNFVVYGGFDWWHASINMRWSINVNGAETAHVESWHHGINDTAASFRPAGAAAPKPADAMGKPDATMAATDRPADFNDDFRPDEGSGSRDTGELGDDGGDRDLMRADHLDGGFGGDGFGDGTGWGRDDFGGRGFAWRRPMFRR